MLKKNYILLILYILNGNFNIYAQGINRYNTFSYSVNEGLLQTTISDLEIDKNNFCWIAFPNGIQKFDGNRFVNIPIQPGLPDDKYGNFFRLKNGDLLISHSKGISRYNINNNKFTLLYDQPYKMQRPVKFIGEDEGNIYIFDENAVISGISLASHNIVSTISSGLPGYSTNGNFVPVFSQNIIEHKVSIYIDKIIYRWDLSKAQLSGHQTITLPTLTSRLLFMKSADEVLFTNYASNTAIQCWNFESKTLQSFSIKGKKEEPFGKSILFPWQNKFLLVNNGHINIIDSSSFALRQEFMNFQNQPVSGGFTIANIKQDDFGNLYLQTVTGGIKKIMRNNYPIKYYVIPNAKSKNVLTVLPDKKNNRILLGGEGLAIFDSSQQLIKEFKTVPGTNRLLFPNGILKSADGSYYIFCRGEKLVFHLDKDLTILKPISIKTHLSAENSGTDYFGHVLYNNGNQALMQSQAKIFQLNFSNNEIFEQIFSNGYVMGGLYYGDMVISHGNDELIFFKPGNLNEIKKIPFKNTGDVRCIISDKDGHLYIGSNNGIFKTDINGNILKQWNKKLGIPDDCIYSMALDKQGALWCSCNKGIFRISSDGNIFQLTRDDGLQENEFNTNVSAVADDGEFFFGGVNGVSSFYPYAIQNNKEPVNLFITGIKVNNKDFFTDTAAWNINKITLQHRQNSLSFDFVAMGNYNPGQYIYQYKMKGADNQWIQNNNLQSLRYSLVPGKYVLQLYASRFFDEHAKPIREIAIEITPPFWNSTWFRILLALLAITLPYYFIYQNNKKKYAKQLQQLENEQQIKQERERISKDLHDSLGIYANAVLYNAEILENEKQDANRKAILTQLKFASKDIITSLREMVWALKKESYTAEECLVRIRNFIQPLSRYYQHISFMIDGEAPQQTSFHYTKALNIVRIVQEAVANSIKHSETKSIKISSTLTDNNNWKISIADSGIGFDFAPEKEAASGNGLTNMEQRAADSDIDFNIDSKPKQGTIITLII